MNNGQHYNMPYIWAISLVAALGGLLFGYDWVVIGSGADIFYERFFNLTEASRQSWAKSSALVGCLVGALLSGMLTDKFGRKRLLITAGFMFTASAIGTGLAGNYNAFIGFRILGGIGIGLASNLSPMYIAEIAPAHIRGKLVSINQLTIVIGVLMAQLVNWLIAEPVPQDATAQEMLNSWNVMYGWRWMFGAETVPAFLFFALMFIIPESPRWLVKHAGDEQARNILARIGGDSYADSEVKHIKNTLIDEINKVNFKDLLEVKMMLILFIGVFLAVFQQWCGINVIFYYAKDVFAAAGYDDVSNILLNIVYTGSIMLVFTFIAIVAADKLGRRKLMLIGAGGLAIIYALVGSGYYFQWPGVWVLVLVLAAVACYSFTLAPITWVILSEIYPNRIRGAAMSISVFALWAACFSVAQTFPAINEAWGAARTFWLYGTICAIGFLFIFWRLPETRGKTLEEIEIELVD